jgi:hypothetical protein
MNPVNVYLPALYIKLGHKNFFRVINQNSARFVYLKNNFSTIRDANPRRIFIGSQIRELI